MFKLEKTDLIKISINNALLFSRLQGIFNSWSSSINSFMPDREAVREDTSVSVIKSPIIRPHNTHTHSFTHTVDKRPTRRPFCHLRYYLVIPLTSSVVWHDNWGKEQGFTKLYKKEIMQTGKLSVARLAETLDFIHLSNVCVSMITHMRMCYVASCCFYTKQTENYILPFLWKMWVVLKQAKLSAKRLVCCEWLPRCCFAVARVFWMFVRWLFTKHH